MLSIVRFGLCFIVVMNHYFELVLGEEIIGNFFTSQIAIDGFFIVSGYLIYQSVQRNNQATFIQKRIKRIFTPYLIVISIMTMFAILISGQIDLDILRYFSANIIFANFLFPQLYGIFGDNHAIEFNGSLWTLKIEVGFYVIIALLYYYTPYLHRMRGVLVMMILSVSLYVASLLLEWPPSIERQLPFQLYKFVFGMLLYCGISEIGRLKKSSGWHFFSTLNFNIAIIVVAVALVSFYIIRSSVFLNLIVLLSIIIALLVNHFVKDNFKKIDISYEIYLVHAFIMQCAYFAEITSFSIIILLTIIASIGLRHLTLKINNFFT